MTDTKNFKAAEFACKCGCGAEAMNQELVNLLQELRERCGFKITITSGTRCPHHNEAVGGKANSEHLPNPETLGVDIAAADDRHRFVLLKNIIEMGFTRIGIGRNFLHVGISSQHPSRVVWRYS